MGSGKVPPYPSQLEDARSAVSSVLVEPTCADRTSQRPFSGYRQDLREGRSCRIGSRGERRAGGRGGAW